MASKPTPAHEENRSSDASGVYDSSVRRDDDATLVERIRAGEPDATELLYFKHFDNVRGVCFRLLGPGFDHEDVIHDVFVESLAHISELRDPKALRAWVVGIAVRTCRRRVQSKTRKWWLQFSPPEEVPDQAMASDAAAGAGLKKVNEILQTIPYEYRTALILRRVEGMTLPEGATACGVSLATFKRRLKRAEEKFHAAAKDELLLQEWYTPRRSG